MEKHDGVGAYALPSWCVSCLFGVLVVASHRFRGEGTPWRRLSPRRNAEGLRFPARKPLSQNAPFAERHQSPDVCGPPYGTQEHRWTQGLRHALGSGDVSSCLRVECVVSSWSGQHFLSRHNHHRDISQTFVLSSYPTKFNRIRKPNLSSSKPQTPCPRVRNESPRPQALS